MFRSSPNQLLVALLVALWSVNPGVSAAKPREASFSAKTPGLTKKILEMALKATTRAWRKGKGTKPILTIIDYSRPSTAKRLWVLDLEANKLLFHELVAHGKGSGDNRARTFSNQPGSLASSLGLYQTGGTYQGKHGYTLKLRGLEPGFNDKAEDRSIVIHGAWYVSAAFAKQHGRLGRSWGCPALRKAISKRLIDTIKDGSLIFAYYPDRAWLGGSSYLGERTGD